MLTFHGLGDPPDQTPEAARGVWLPVAWLGALLDAVPDDTVKLTFDDGYASDIEDALPALLQRGLTATFFLPVGELNKPGRLTTEHVSHLHAAGMTIGTHGLHHRDWRRLSSDELTHDLMGSRRILSEMVNGDVAEAACPFGSYDRHVLRALREAGYQRVYTSDGGPSRRGSWLTPRTTISRTCPLQTWLDFVSSGPARRPHPVLLAKRYAKRLRGAPTSGYERQGAQAAAR